MIGPQQDEAKKPLPLAAVSLSGAYSYDRNPKLALHWPQKFKAWFIGAVSRRLGGAVHDRRL